jgi:hypothetical protein
MDNEIKTGMMKYCVVGNIIKERLDENGVRRFGTASFPGGRKVYISKHLSSDGVIVLGLNRFNRYVEERISLFWIENIRFSKTYTPRILEFMTKISEYPQMWFSYKEEDKTEAKEYAQILYSIKNGDQEALENYTRNVMSRFY